VPLFFGSIRFSLPLKTEDARVVKHSEPAFAYQPDGLAASKTL
jgi:hypothetical protein